MTSSATSENLSPPVVPTAFGLPTALGLPMVIVITATLVMSFLIVSRISVAAVRSPISAPIENVDFKRDLLAGSDALLERMVIPPNRPDWVVMDCAGQSNVETVFDRVRDSLCDLKRN